MPATADVSADLTVTGRGHLDEIPAALELAVGTREKLERLPVDWWHVWRLGRPSGERPSTR